MILAKLIPAREKIFSTTITCPQLIKARAASRTRARTQLPEVTAITGNIDIVLIGWDIISKINIDTRAHTDSRTPTYIHSHTKRTVKVDILVISGEVYRFSIYLVQLIS